MSEYEAGWRAAIDAAEKAMVSYKGIDLMTPPDSPLFQLFFALKERVVALRNTLPTEADLS